jgi:GNAT superfamily N-acetyltransferase
MHPPEPLATRHDIDAFANGRHDTLDQWLKTRARTSEGLSARTYVICDPAAPDRVIGYYAISTAMAYRANLPNAKLRKDMPDEIPLLLIGRLAVDTEHHGSGLGAGLLKDALLRCGAAGAIAGVRGIIAHAIDDAAATFYLRHGFMSAPTLGERVVLLPTERQR